MTANNTNTRRNIENMVPRAARNGARIRNLEAESPRNQVSLLALVNKSTISEAVVGDHFRKPSRSRLEVVPYEGPLVDRCLINFPPGAPGGPQKQEGANQQVCKDRWCTFGSNACMLVFKGC
jgi:hypothetical protein